MPDPRWQELLLPAENKIPERREQRPDNCLIRTLFYLNDHIGTAAIAGAEKPPGSLLRLAQDSRAPASLP